MSRWANLGDPWALAGSLSGGPNPSTQTNGNITQKSDGDYEKREAWEILREKTKARAKPDRQEKLLDVECCCCR